MNKISENQRKYMARRINEEFDNAVSLIKQKEAVKIQKITSKAEDTYKKTLGISKQVNRFIKAEEELKAAKQECEDIVNAMESHTPTSDKMKRQYSFSGYNGSISIYDSGSMKKYITMRCTDLALKNFGDTKEGAEMNKLEERRKRAVDYIYGLTRTNDIAVGLNKILKGTSINLQLGE
tara:strand:- start:2323 stop:2859 length:537 start_codon:yes stop_codon:yes gene_type:complete